MSALKTKHPCKHCGEPAEIGSRREAEHAHCARCRERNRLVRGANLSAGLVPVYMRRIPKDGPESARIAAYLSALECAVMAAQRAAEAVAPAQMNERRALLRVSRSHVEWAISALTQLRDVYDAAMNEERRGLEVVEGGCEIAEVTERPVLRLVQAERMAGER